MSKSKSLPRTKKVSFFHISSSSFSIKKNQATTSSNTNTNTKSIKDKIFGSLTQQQEQQEREQKEEQRQEYSIPNIGDYAFLPHAFSHDNIVTFSQLSGDDNPMHLDDEYTRNQGGIFKGRIAHGLLVGSLFGIYLSFIYSTLPY